MAAPRSLLQKMKDREKDVMAEVDAQTSGSPPPAASKPSPRSTPPAPSPVSGPTAKGLYNKRKAQTKKRGY